MNQHCRQWSGCRNDNLRFCQWRQSGHHDSPRLSITLLTYWARVTHICVSKLANIGSDNGLSPDRRQAIIWTNAGILLIGPLGTIFSEILIEISTFPFTKTRLKVSSAKWWPFCLGLNVLSQYIMPWYARGIPIIYSIRRRICLELF